MLNFNRNGGNIWIAVAIIIAAVVIAGAVLLSDGPNKGEKVDTSDLDWYGEVSEIRMPSADEHVRGDLNAPVIIIEYSDTECPFCSKFHNTLDEITSENTEVAWVYRHLPLTQLHSQAVAEAHATECATELGGNEGFWKYIDRLYETTPMNQQIDLKELPNIAEYAGLDRVEFDECMAEERQLSAVEEDFREAVKVAGKSLGTPLSVLVLKTPMSNETFEKFEEIAKAFVDKNGRRLILSSMNKDRIIISGAHKKETLESIIDIILF